MAIFKKSALQGHFILSNGVQVLFDDAGYLETDDENVISQLKGIYEEVDEKPVAEETQVPEADQQEAQPAAPVAEVKTGIQSTAALANLTKK